MQFKGQHSLVFKYHQIQEHLHVTQQDQKTRLRVAIANSTDF